MVAGCGAIPVLLPPHGQTPEVLDRVDGLLIAGGADVTAEAYGQVPHERTASQPFPRRVRVPPLPRRAGARPPVLGICRGLQVITVATGGTLIQHLPEVLGHSDYQPNPGVYGEVAVTTEPGGLARAILGEAATAPCYHHQAVDRLGEDSSSPPAAVTDLSKPSNPTLPALRRPVRTGGCSRCSGTPSTTRTTPASSQPSSTRPGGG